LAGATILPWALPLAGLSGTQTISQWRRASAGLDPATDHQPPERRADNSFAADHSYPLMGLLDDPSHHVHARRDSRGELPPRHDSRVA